MPYRQSTASMAVWVRLDKRLLDVKAQEPLSLHDLRELPVVDVPFGNV